MIPLQGVHSFWDKDPLSVYPNPAREELTISFESDATSVPEVQIIDLTGKVVLKVKEPLNREEKTFKTSLSVGHLNSGIYFVKVIQGKEVYTRKLMIE